jgi:hypothetical protein
VLGSQDGNVSMATYAQGISERGKMVNGRMIGHSVQFCSNANRWVCTEYMGNSRKSENERPDASAEPRQDNSDNPRSPVNVENLKQLNYVMKSCGPQDEVAPSMWAMQGATHLVEQFKGPVPKQQGIGFPVPVLLVTDTDGRYLASNQWNCHCESC